MEHTRESLVQRMRQQRQNITEWFADLEHWNRSRPTEAFTLEQVDPGGVMARMAAELDLSLAREDGLLARQQRELGVIQEMWDAGAGDMPQNSPE